MRLACNLALAELPQVLFHRLSPYRPDPFCNPVVFPNTFRNDLMRYSIHGSGRELKPLGSPSDRDDRRVNDRCRTKLAGYDLRIDSSDLDASVVGHRVKLRRRHYYRMVYELVIFD
jgi:hypothetical protein